MANLEGIAEAIDNLENLTEKIQKTPDEAERAALLTKADDLDKKIMELSNVNIDADTEEYKRAAAELNKANQALKEAIDDLNTAAVWINRAAEAISAIADILNMKMVLAYAAKTLSYAATKKSWQVVPSTCPVCRAEMTYEYIIACTRLTELEPGESKVRKPKFSPSLPNLGPGEKKKVKLYCPNKHQNEYTVIPL